MPAKLTTEKFIEKAKKVFGDMYTYENTNYVHSQTKVTVTCPVHKSFQILPAMHLRGRGCTFCGNENAGAPHYDQEKFLQLVREKHGYLYDYSKTVYNGSHEKVTIICKVHGEFSQTAGAHVHGTGCPKCANDYVTSFTRDSTESFIAKARLVHGDRFDYSPVQYVQNGKKINFLCRRHGTITMTPNSHLNGNGCKHCNKEERSTKKGCTTLLKSL